MLQKFRNWCIGKSLSYWDNAIEDAQVSDDIVRSVMSGVRDPMDPRSSKFCRGEKVDRLIYAYTLYYINGYLDYVAARLFGTLGGVERHLHTKYFKDTSWLCLFDWLRPLIGDNSRIVNFLARSNLLTQFTTNEILNAIKYVQVTNIARNLANAKLAVRNKSSLLVKFRLDPTKFDKQNILDSYIETQKRAIFWDKIYIKLIDLRLR